MTPAVCRLLKAYDALPPAEQQEVANEIARRAGLASEYDLEAYGIIRVPANFLSELEKEPVLTPGLRKLAAMMRGDV
jgi:hypothetical protein